MDWFAVDPNYPDDPAIVAAGEAAEVLFMRGCAYSSRALSRGFVPTDMVGRLTPSSTRRRVEALVREGLWLEVEGGWHIRSWEKWQALHDAAEERRRKDRERKAAQRIQGGSA